MKVTVYSKPACPQCDATKRYLSTKGIEFDVVDVSKDETARNLVTGMGYRQAPVVIAGDNHWAGFRPEMINALAA